MKKIKITLGATTLIGLFCIGLTIHTKATNYLRNELFDSPKTALDYPQNDTNNDNDEDHQNHIQLALLLDTSGSMGGLIEQTKSQLWKIVNELSTLKKNGQTPTLEIALYEYGTQNFQENSWIRQISSFTTDMDMISEALFQLRTTGSNEYCGLVMQKSLNELQWNDQQNSLQIIYIAGNESFAQGPIDYRQVVQQAKEQGIFVNTLFCGLQEEGIALEWQRGALLGGGNFANIDHNQETVYIESPFDQQINTLNEALNDTYISYGKNGHKALQNMRRQDTNAQSYSLANNVERAAFKSSSNYANEHWDLIDAYQKDRTIAARKDGLPENLANLTKEEVETLIQEKMAQRNQIKANIQQLNQQRKQFLAEKIQTQDVANLENSILSAIRNQAKTKGWAGETVSISTNLAPSLVDYPAFLTLSQKVAIYREKRLVDVEKFLELSKQPGTIILDTRSQVAYEGKHIKGAIHLNFSDFTAEKLEKIIPSKDAQILIYCNNNFSGDPVSFAAKSVPLALNIPTFINLYGYGYKNIYELADLVPMESAKLEFVGKLVK